MSVFTAPADSFPTVRQSTSVLCATAERFEPMIGWRQQGVFSPTMKGALSGDSACVFERGTHVYEGFVSGIISRFFCTSPALCLACGQECAPMVSTECDPCGGLSGKRCGFAPTSGCSRGICGARTAQANRDGHACSKLCSAWFVVIHGTRPVVMQRWLGWRRRWWWCVCHVQSTAHRQEPGHDHHGQAGHRRL